MTPRAKLCLAEDPLLGLQRRLGLAPREGHGAVRRALFLALLTWVPMAAWAAVRGRLMPGEVADPLLHHVEVHVRCLVAIPLLVLAEPAAQRVMERVLDHFAASGLVPGADGSRLEAAVRAASRLLGSPWAWGTLAALVIAVSIAGNEGARGGDSVSWATTGEGLGFGGHWYNWVAKPVFNLLVAAWLWRLGVVTWLMTRIAALGLDLSPAHPDRAGGLGFLEVVPAAFTPVILALSATLAGHMSHEIAYHGVHAASYKMTAGVFVTLLSVLFILPLLVFSRPLLEPRFDARFEYGAVAWRQTRSLHPRGPSGPEGAAPLPADDVSAAADVGTVYGIAANMKPTVIGIRALASVLSPAALPMLAPASLEVPLGEILLKLLKTLG